MQTPVSSQITVVVLAFKRKVSPEITATRSDWYTFCFLAGLSINKKDFWSVLLTGRPPDTIASHPSIFPSSNVVGIEHWDCKSWCLLSKLHCLPSTGTAFKSFCPDRQAKLWLSSSTTVLAQPASRSSTALLDSVPTTDSGARSCASKYSRYSCVKHSMALLNHWAGELQLCSSSMGLIDSAAANLSLLHCLRTAEVHL